DHSSSGVSGYSLGVSLPFFVGLGMDSYTASFPAKGGAGKFDYTVNMYNLFVNLPIPVVNIALGVGAGTGHVGGSSAGSYKDADLTQFMASFGFNILPLVDLHLGFRGFTGTNKPKGTNTSKTDVDGKTYTLGVKVGF